MTNNCCLVQLLFSNKDKPATKFAGAQQLVRIMISSFLHLNKK